MALECDLDLEFFWVIFECENKKFGQILNKKVVQELMFLSESLIHAKMNLIKNERR